MKISVKNQVMYWPVISVPILAAVFPGLLRVPAVLGGYTLIALIVASVWVRSNRTISRQLKYLMLFAVVGVSYAFLSFLGGGWADGYLFDRGHILRQAYFVLLFPVATIAAMHFYTKKYSHINEYVKRNGVLFLSVIIVLDISSAWLLGGEVFKEFNGYAYYLEKSIVWLVYGYIYYYKVSVASQRVAFYIFLATTFAMLFERLMGYGTIFNAATGVILYLIMLFFYFAKAVNSSRVLIVFCISSLALLGLLLFVAPFFSALFQSDVNTFWRLESWRENIVAVIGCGGFGVGFGVSYFPATPEAIDYALRASLAEGSTLGAYDNLFVRGQHSSLINILFRTGVLGFIVFMLFLGSIIAASIKLKAREDVYFLMPLFLSGLFNISLHVGLESPPYCIAFSIATGFLLSALVRSGHH